MQLHYLVPSMTNLLLASLVLVAFLCLPLASPRRTLNKEDISFPKDWHVWKGEHSKSYQDLQEELSKHLVWLGNREYINQHNQFSHVFGYTLKMNRFGDMVR